METLEEGASLEKPQEGRPRPQYLQLPRPLPHRPMGGLDVRMWEARPGCYSLSWAAAGAASGARGGEPWTGWKVRREGMLPRGLSGPERPGPGLRGQVRPAGSAPRSPRSPAPGTELAGPLQERWPRAALRVQSSASPRGLSPRVLSLQGLTTISGPS